MADKDNYERILGIDLFLYFLPLIGLFLLWKDRNKLSTINLISGMAFGIINLIILINEIIRYDLI